jgi:hypothetical protein
MAKKTAKDKKIKLTLTLGEVVSEFFPAVSHLGSLAIKNTEITWALATAGRQAKQHVKDYNEARTQLAEASCLRDEDDKPIIEEKRYAYPDEKTEREANDLIRDLEKKEVEIEVKQFKISVLRNIEGVTGNAIMSCGDMFIE